MIATRRALTLLLWCIIAVVVLSGCAGSVPKSLIPSGGDVKILSHNGYMVSDMIGTYAIVVGEVQNTGKDVLRYVKITATLYDSEDNILATHYTYAQIKVLLPGQKSPFIFIKLSSAERYGLEVTEFRPTTDEPYRDFEILSHSSFIDDDGHYRVTGELKNTGTRSANDTEVIATFYDASGEVVGASVIATVDPRHVPRGETASFDVQATPKETASDIATYALQVQCE